MGPNYVRPPVTSPDGYRGEVAAPEAKSIADLPWWEVFKDQVLQGLIAEAIENNYDLKTAVFRVEQARALAGVAASPLWPQVQYQGGAGRGKLPVVETQPSQTFNLFAGSISVAWEIDVWGRIRRASEAAQEAMLATEAFRRGVLLSLVTGVAQSYLTLLELDQELNIAKDTEKAYQETLLLFTRRYRGGVGDQLQVSRAEASLAQ